MQMVAKRDGKQKAESRAEQEQEQEPEDIIWHTQYHRQNIMNPFYLQAMREAEKLRP
jgi:hypothetical protein